MPKKSPPLAKPKRRPSAKETAARAAAHRAALTAPRPALIPQPHGGALFAGGAPGNKGSTGPLASQVRAGLLRSFVERSHHLSNHAAGVATLSIQEACPKCGYVPTKADAELGKQTTKLTASDQQRALGMMLEYAIGPVKPVSLDEVSGKLEEQQRILRELAPPDLFDAINARLEKVWL